MTTRDDVLARLRAAGSAGVSGEAIAHELGISRAAVAKHVSALRSRGYGISALAGTGYRFESAPDIPLPSEVGPLVTDDFWVRIEGAETTGSTNDDARALALAGAPEGTVVVAAAQTAGRGRLGRAWDSPTGGVYLSAVLRPPIAPVALASLSLVVGLGVAEALEGLGAAPRLKWPNDVVLAGGKVAGILLEMSAEADRVEWVVAGVGINVESPGGDAPSGAAYLAADIPEMSRPVVAAALLDGIAGAYRRLLAGGFASLRGSWNDRDALSGADVEVRNAEGTRIASGRAQGVDAEGRLLVTSPTGTVSVAAGEVTLRSSTLS